MAERTQLYETVCDYMEELFENDPGIYLHLIRTADWVGQLLPDAGEALMIAAVSHDIKQVKDTDPLLQQGFDTPEYLLYHQEESGKMMEKYLLKQGASTALAEQVRQLISKHEVGGDEEQDLLKDADSISFFENQVDDFLSKKIHTWGEDRVRKKFDWMFDRISSDEARDIVRPAFDEAMAGLDELRR